MSSDGGHGTAQGHECKDNVDFLFTPANKNQQVKEADGTADAANGDVSIGEEVWHG
jgi:hypothetical protein